MARAIKAGSGGTELPTSSSDYDAATVSGGSGSSSGGLKILNLDGELTTLRVAAVGGKKLEEQLASSSGALRKVWNEAQMKAGVHVPCST